MSSKGAPILFGDNCSHQIHRLFGGEWVHTTQHESAPKRNLDQFYRFAGSHRKITQLHL